MATYRVTATGEVSGTATSLLHRRQRLREERQHRPRRRCCRIQARTWSNEGGCPAVAPNKTPPSRSPGRGHIRQPCGRELRWCQQRRFGEGQLPESSLRIRLRNLEHGHRGAQRKLRQQRRLQSGLTSFCVNITESNPSRTFVGLVKTTVTPPTAKAGSDQTVNEGATVNLDGSTSTGATSYSWKQLTGTSVTLTGSSTATPSFAAPDGPATLTFEFKPRTRRATAPTKSRSKSKTSLRRSCCPARPRRAKTRPRPTPTRSPTPATPRRHLGDRGLRQRSHLRRHGRRQQLRLHLHRGRVADRQSHAPNDGNDSGSDSKVGHRLRGRPDRCALGRRPRQTRAPDKTYTYTVSGAPTTVVESCGANGTKTDTAAAQSFDCTFPDGPGVFDGGSLGDGGRRHRFGQPAP